MEDKRTWLTNVYRCIFFNEFVSQKVEAEVTDSNYSIADVQNNNDVSSFHDFVDDEESELCDSLS